MAGASEGYHEEEGRLCLETKDLHRALVSLREELEAIDWYRQRIDATDSSTLKAVLRHNMEEEVEHACMMLEWLRRHEPLFEKNLRTYLFQEQPITTIEEHEENPPGVPSPAPRSPRLGLTIGKMKGE